MSDRISLFSDDPPPIPDDNRLPDEADEPTPTPAPSDPVMQMPPLEEDEGSIPLRRYVDSLRRHRWLILACLAIGAAVAYGSWRMAEPDYVAQGAVWVESSGRQNQERGPIRAGELLAAQSWVDLLKSFAVLDSVAVGQSLYVRSATPQRASLFRDFRISHEFRPGDYSIQADTTGRYVLRTARGIVVERGQLGDSIGRQIGFLWQPAPEKFEAGEPISFTVLHPRDASRSLRDRLRTRMDEAGNFIQVELTGKDPEQIAAVLNAILERFVGLAAELKRSQLETFVQVLEEQRESVGEELAEAEGALEGYRVETITLPSDATIPIAPGLEATQDPVFTNFFQMRVDEEELRRDLANLNELIETIPSRGVRVEAFEVLPSVRTSPELMDALEELSTKRAQLRALLYTYTETYQPVRDLQREIQVLERETIPRLARALASEMRSRLDQIQERIASASAELRAIPTRTIEEGRLRRQMDAADDLYRELDQRYEQARLELSASVPDVRVLDEAAVPQVPTNDERIRMALLILLGGLGAGMAGAVLLDRVDPKVRYPEQVTDLGLEVLGAIPRIRQQNGRKGPENAAQVLEAFRELRTNVSYAFGSAGPIVLTISSPGQGEGKSFVSTNLAVAFAEMGQKTLLIDADTRRGDLHELLDRRRRPGLIDGIVRYLSSSPEGKGIIQPTDYSKLHFISSGTRQANSPELLANPIFREIMARVKRRYEVIIVDSPPLGAGGDAFILAATTGNLLLVIRNGATLKELAAVKMEPLERLPVRILGAVLNDLEPKGIYERYYYSYIPGYEAGSEEGDHVPARKLLQTGSVED